jgi:hypothetical protein
MRGAARRWLGRLTGRAVVIPFEYVLEVERFPTEIRERVWSALRAYQPHEASSYPGRVMLIRARTQPLRCRAETDLGWGRLAQGGVDLRIDPDPITTYSSVRLSRTLPASSTRRCGPV